MWVALLLLSSTVWGQDIQINASSSRTTVGLNEPFRITWSWSARNTQLTPPKMNDFIIVSGPYQSSQTQIINGSASFTRKLSYEVVATKEGRFTIAPATLMDGGKLYKSNTLNIEVKQGVKRKNALSQKAKESFDVQILTSKKEVYVGEPIVLLMQAYLYEPVRDLNILQAPNFENVLQKELDFEQSQRGEMVEGKLATVLDFSKRLILPNKPGTLGGQELKISGKVQVPTGRRDFFGMPLTKFVQEVATANIPAVKIKPLPTPKPENFSGAVGSLKFIRDVSRTRIGGEESITVKVRIEGNGNFNTISVPDLQQPQGFDVYDPKYNESIRYSERGVRGFKEYEYLLVPQFKGSFLLPEMRFTYFDTKKGAYETIVALTDTLIVESDELAATPAGGFGDESTKREVKTIDEDIRYLQDGSNTPYVEIELKKWSWAVLLLLGLAWGVHAIPRKQTAAVVSSKRKSLKREVTQAFAQKSNDRHGIMLNALEELLLEQGIGREQNHEHALQQRNGEEVAADYVFIKERCQMAQYAPGTAADDAELVKRFDVLWDKI